MFSSIGNAEAAREFCEHHDCPANWKDADGENCCIHHANIHSCPMGYMVHTLIFNLLRFLYFPSALFEAVVMSKPLWWFQTNQGKVPHVR